MRFILTAGCLTHFDALRDQYQKEKKIDLNIKPSKIGVPTLFGATDVESREAQISFLEKIHTIVQASLLKEEDINTPEQWQANVTASRILIAACLYVQSQIGWSKRNSTLYRLIECSLGITAKNYLDEEDKEMCYLAANRLVNSSKIDLEEANFCLKKAKFGPLSERDWHAFSGFLSERCSAVKANNAYSNYPFTSLTRPLFGAVFAYTGASVGYIGGDMISNSANGMVTKYRLTTLIGSSLLVLGPVSSTSIALFAPVIAGRLITTYCSISLAHILGVTMGLLGQGIGIGVGLPLDLAYQLIWKACALINDQCGKDKSIPAITGLRIADGVALINGLVFEILPEEELPKHYNSLEINEQGDLLLNNELVDVFQNKQKLLTGGENEVALEDFFIKKDPLASHLIPHNDLVLAQQRFQ